MHKSRTTKYEIRNYSSPSEQYKVDIPHFHYECLVLTRSVQLESSSCML